MGLVMLKEKNLGVRICFCKDQGCIPRRNKAKKKKKKNEKQ